ncbi:MAG: type II toxin-antitoxin system VapC family toxin [Nitriliruptor sp.]
MSVAYFDSSALVKLVIDEPGSDDAAWLWDAADSVLTSRVAHPEVRAALAAAHRALRLTAEGYRRATGDWQQLRRGMRLVEVTPRIEHDAGELAEQHALSGFDAVHLASALTLASVPVVVATWDARLHRAVRASGLAALPVVAD